MKYHAIVSDTNELLERNGYIKLGRAKVARPGSIAWWTICGIECAGLLMVVATAIGLAWIL